MYTYKDSGCEVDDGTRGNICSMRLNVLDMIRLGMSAESRLVRIISEKFVRFYN